MENEDMVIQDLIDSLENLKKEISYIAYELQIFMGRLKLLVDDKTVEKRILTSDLESEILNFEKRMDKILNECSRKRRYLSGVIDMYGSESEGSNEFN